MQTIKAVLSQDLITSLTRSDSRKGSKNLKSSTVNALCFIGNKITGADIAKAEAMIEMNYGAEYPKEKFQMLWEMFREDNWTDVRLRETLKWFLKNKRFPSWTIADWYDYGVNLHNYSKYLEMLSTKGIQINDEIEWFEIKGQKLFGFKSELIGISKLIREESK